MWDKERVRLEEEVDSQTEAIVVMVNHGLVCHCVAVSDAIFG